MKDVDKDRKRLVDELEGLRQRIAELEISEAERSKAEEKYRLLIENAAEAISVAQDGKIRFANPKLTELTGYTVEELNSVSPLEVVHPDDRNMVMDYHARTLKGENLPQTYTFRIIDKGGNIKWLERNVALITWEGKPAAVVFDTDITERKRLEKYVEEERQDFSLIIDSSPVIVFYKDKDGRLMRVNKAFAEALGIPKEEFLGKTVFDFYSTEIAQGMTNDDQEVLKSGRPKLNIIEKYESASGIRWARTDKIPILDRGGIPVGLVGFAQDITDWKKMQEALLESEAKYRELAESITDVFFALDNKLRYTHWNKASEELTGISAKDALGKHIYDIFPDTEDTIRAVSAYRRTLATREPQHFVNKYSLGGRDYVFDVNTYPTKGGLCVYVKDATERRKLEDALDESEQWYRHIFDNAPFGIGFASIDGRVINLNKAMEVITGYSAEEFNKFNLADTYVNKSDRETLLQEVRRHGGVVDYPVRLRRKDGTPYDALLSVRLTNIGDREFVQTICQDVTERMRAEEALRLSERNFRNSMESSPLGIRIVDEDGKMLYANRALLDICGYNSLEELGAVPREHLYTPQSYAEHRERIKKRQRGEHVPLNYEISIVRKDGQVRYLTVSRGEVLWNGERQFQVVYQDITERRQAEEEYQTIIHAAMDGFWQADMQGHFLDVNEAYCHLVGYSRDELLNMIIADIEVIETQEEIAKHMQKIREVGYDRFESRHRCKGGEIIDVDVSVNYLPTHGGRMFTFIRDITERKRAEEALRESEGRYRLLAENVRDVIWAMDMDLRFVYVSPSVKYLGYRTAEEVMSMSLEQLLAPSSQKLAVKTFAEEIAMADVTALDPNRSRVIEVEIIRRDGSTIWAELRMNFMRDSFGRPTGILGVMRDVSERKKAEEERKEMEQKAQLASRLASVGELSAGIAHEINNPLTGVIGYSDLLMQEDVPEHIKRDLEVINDGAKRVAGIVKGLLTFARQTRPERTVVDINQVIEVVLRLRAYELETSNIKVTARLASDLPVTVADAGQVQQVFLNLIINAEAEMRSAHGKGKLTIKTEQIDNTIRVSFKDDGPGIAEENLERIFDPFFTTREIGKGTGLGLSICHGIVTEHKGRIYVESQLGKGATFIVELPVVTEKKRSRRAKPAGKPERAIRGKILVVDDEPVVRQLLSQVLTEDGHEVETTDDGKDALNRIKGNKYSLILLDMKLPGMSGSELYQRIRESDESLVHSVVFMTGDVMGADTEAFLNRTGVPYLTKPFDIKKLGAEIKRLLALCRSKPTHQVKNKKPKLRK